MQLALYEKYDLRLPRYTSYPTAPHFHSGIQGEQFARWLGELDPAQPLSLYLHVPYCEKMCWFCGCNTQITHRYQPVSQYVDLLLEEIDQRLSLLPHGQRFNVAHLHFGGGSPTILSASDLNRIMELLRSRLDILPTAEVALEMDPRTSTDAFIDAMAANGFNRASIGIQDFNPAVQKAVNREQSLEDVADIINKLRAKGINGINVDLMYGLPNQSVETLINTVDQTIGLRPDRLSIFGYAHVPWMKKHQQVIATDTLPDVEERWAQYEAIQNQLAAHGYQAIGLDHFAHRNDSLAIAQRNGELHRNFQGYTTDNAEALIAFGPSAISSLPQGYAQNLTGVGDWRKAIAQGNSALAKGVAVDAEDTLRRDIINRLMCDLSVDLSDLCAQHQTFPDRFLPELDRIRAMTGDGIVEVNGWNIQLTETGRPLVRAVCAAFDGYLEANAQRHSAAV
ncbi:oxygen-independent coproporphyrinogen III oxidase [Saccharospirillum sp. MSK14-1]|uniref:oxygen-independent coproporphyrinogen III oxidase n=1 Tax=Saccharospirillum sp. MSK14-1 TaxID=1897632 RepID=UPI000D3D73B6|nr:oxygen-independent coproporphyrinogen III oxidase [Saccharospirillum sp. MSK14-1]PTY38427.1 oxygen-independent coproporphyrinogen III oxidase [Saccharospirillum sp. MSK14-1]